MHTAWSAYICGNACWKGKVLSWALKSEAERTEKLGRFCKLAGSEFQTVGARKLKEQWPTDLRLHLGIFENFSFDDWKVCEVWYMQRETESKRRVNCQSDSRQKLQSCIRSGISQAANGVHAAVVLNELTFVSPERAKPHCFEPSTVDLFVPKANRLSVSCSKQCGR